MPLLSVLALLSGPAQAQDGGSLWNEDQAWLLIGQSGTGRNVGDLVTVVIVESSSSMLSAGTSANRDSNNEAGVTSIFGLKKRITGRHPDMDGAISLGTTSDTSFSGDGATSRGGELQGLLTCTVTEVLENGNLRIQGRKEVRSGLEIQYIDLIGTVRPQDIQANNTVESYLLADPSIQFTGSGAIEDVQRPGLGTRLFNRIWPF
ncbi:MAG: flagellar basal body L-ring protein FlgH [Myxococcota bacterium]|nr:flagellar basal body L-ring protein FlgH [Myxococcota bacterium]